MDAGPRTIVRTVALGAARYQMRCWSGSHALRYVGGRIHVKGLKNFWSLLKRMLRGTYVAEAHEHLDRYLDDECRRFNLRKGTDASRFDEVMRGIVGKRLRYRELTQAGSFG